MGCGGGSGVMERGVTGGAGTTGFGLGFGLGLGFDSGIGFGLGFG
jgi:hypothetical protein